MGETLYNSPKLARSALHPHDFPVTTAPSAPLSPPSEDSSPDLFSTWTKLGARDYLNMSTPSSKSPPLQELNTDPYLSAPSDPEESDFVASAIRLTPLGESPNHSSPNESRRPSIQAQTYLGLRENGYTPSRPSSYLAPSDIDLVSGSGAWPNGVTSSFSGGVTAPSTNSEWPSSVGVNASRWLSAENTMPSPISASGSLTVPGSVTTAQGSFAAPRQSGLGISSTEYDPSGLSISTNHPPGDDLTSPSTRGRSPIVTVSRVSRGDSPVVYQRRPSRSTAHLSPGDMSSESGDEDDASDLRSVDSLSVARTHNGNWIPNSTTGHGGLDPRSRGNEFVPSPNDLKGQREREQKNEAISMWTESVNVANSEAGDESPSLPRQKPPTTRKRRARSTGDRPLQQEDYFNLQFTSAGRPVPGPGVIVHESSEDEASEESDEAERTYAESPVVDATELAWNDHSTPDIYSSLEQIDSSGNFRLYPWQDPPNDFTPRTDVMQPGSSSAAMVAFEKRARDLETASLTATIDNNSIINFGATFDRLSISEQPKTKGKRSNSILKRPFFQQASSRLKRQASDHSISTVNTATQQAPQEPQHRDSGSHRHRLSLSSISNKHGRSPSLTNALINISGQMAAIGGSHSVRAVSPNPEATPMSLGAKNRGRSRSEVPRPVTPGLIDLMTSHGGPPVAGLYRSPMPGMAAEQTPISAAPRPDTAGAEDDDVDMVDEKGHVMEFPPVSSLPVPTFEGFRAQIMQLNPLLEPALIHRFAQAQARRYRHLVELQQKHSVAVANRSCEAGKFCFALGGEESLLHQGKGPADTETGQTQFCVADFSIGRDQSYALGEGAIAAAHFPPGVPLPPVSHLPAEFECPICFEVKKFHKPSDWSKHVHEDVQPFTCSFPQCTEPKSFKRKADWVRHENERHRQLEWWTCSYADCNHTCFRKNNFVQHLVREHKMPEPKPKKTKGSAGDGSSDSTRERELSRLWKMVDDSRHETEQTLRQEPCRFCGNICGSWTKLTAHLGKHMEQLAMPVLELAKQSCASPHQVHQVGVTGRSTETHAPLAARFHAQHDPSGTSAHLARPQYPTSNASTYEVPLLNYPTISDSDLSMEPESITDPLQPGDPQIAGYMGQFDQCTLHSQAQTHPLHQSPVTYPPPYNAVPRSRTPETNPAMLQHSYSLGSQLQGSLYPAQTGYPAYQPVAPNSPYTTEPYTSSYSSRM
ncbi:uncharacterized protein N7498_005000 [Penicillium cinerascens]|uniref:C2H2-type domain-containing protein n=1 Tax=Penicillium cinerascens TaxID=70096 RepID=A0A9W9MML1_9EURO|nr:uncharacterized protein N7498_005000 [Penicillium cinerascens]KAJ5204121.1 hypothetical protein N7498_005000 [Penicillium cinerascens]